MTCQTGYIFRENLVDESSPSARRRNPAPKDQETSRSSHEVRMESRAKVEPGAGKAQLSTLTSRKTQTAKFA